MRSMRENYQKLEVWKKSMELVERVYPLIRKLPREETYALADQMRRAVVSIPSNIAEGQSRGTREFIRFLKVAKGSRAELETQLLLCARRFRGNQQNALLSDQISKLQDLNSKLSLDIGFRVLKLDDSNMKDVYYAADEYDQKNLEEMVSNIKEDRSDLDLLFGCLLDWGIPLSAPYTSEQIDGCTVHTYNDGDLIACFDKNIPENVVKEIAKRKPLRAVFRDSSFADSPSKINVFEIFKLYMPEDANDISKRVRVI